MQTFSVVILNSLLLQDLEVTARAGWCKERFSSHGKMDYSWSELLEIWSQLIASASQMARDDPKTMQVSGEGSSMSLLDCFAEWTVKRRQQSDYFQPRRGDAPFSWTLPVHSLRQKVLYLLTDQRVVSISPNFSPTAKRSVLDACAHDGPRGWVGRWLHKGRRSLAGLSFSWVGTFSLYGPGWSSGSCSAVLGP